MDYAKINLWGRGKIFQKQKAQVIIEYTLAFLVLMVFLLATTKVFVWLGDNIVNRHKAYEDTRTAVAPGGGGTGSPTGGGGGFGGGGGWGGGGAGGVSGQGVAQPPAVDFYNNTTGKKDMDIFEGKNIIE